MNINQIILSAKTGTTAPTLVTPDFIGQLYIDTTSNVIYYAQSLTTGDYAELTRVDDLTTALSTKMDVDGTNSDIEILNFKISEPKPAHAEGKVFYDAEEHALVCYNDETEITQQLGHEHYIRVFNDTGSTLLNGKVVHLTDVEPVEFRPKVELAQADSRDNASVIGMTTHDIEDGTFGYITILGMIHDLDTSAYSSGDILYLSTTIPGELVDELPKEGEIIFKVGTVVRVHATEGSVYVDLSDRGALTEFSLIRDVLGTTWKNGLVVSPNTPNDQSVDYTNGEYFISGTIYEITPSGNLDLTSYYAALSNNQHALLKIYVDEDETLKIAIGTPVALNLQSTEPTIPVNTIAIALVEIGKDILGNPIDIDADAVTDERQTLSKQAGSSLDEFVRVGDSDTVSKHLEDALNSNGNVTFTVENEGGNESLRADASLDAEDIPTDELGITVQDKLDELESDIDNHLADTANPHAVTKTQVGLGNVTDDAQLKRAAADFDSFTGKTTPVDADITLIEDSAASLAKKKLSWANIKATLKTYFDTLYNLYVHPNHTGDVTSIADGATTIAADAVTNTKLANMATKTYKGRTTAGTGDPEDVSIASLKADLSLDNVTNDAQLKRASGDFASFTGKTTPVDADITLIEDSAASNAKKSLTWANIKATLKTYFDTLYPSVTTVKSQYFIQSPENTTNLGDHKMQSVAQNGSFRLGFDIPIEATSIVGIDLIFVPTGTIAAAQTLTANTDYGALTENSANHSQTSAVVPIAGTAGQFTACSLTSVFTSIAAGDIAGVAISLNGIGTGISVFGIRVRYT